MLLLPLLLLLSLSLPPSTTSQPLTPPVARESDLPTSNYTVLAPLSIEDVQGGTDVHSLRSSRRSRSSPNCSAFHHHRFDLAWQVHADSGVYATGLITESLHHDEDAQHSSNKLLVLPGFHHHLHLLDHDGHHLPTSPLLFSTSTLSAPFHTSPVLFDYNGDGHDDLIWINVDGVLLLINGHLGAQPLLLASPTRIPRLAIHHQWMRGMDIQALQRGETPHTEPEPSPPPPTDDHNSPPHGVAGVRHDPPPTPRNPSAPTPPTPPTGRRLLQVTDDEVFEHLLDNLPEEARASLLLFSQSPASSIVQFDDEEMGGEVQGDPPAGHIWVDPHVLATPTLCDWDHDGAWNELAISVSYFFDQDFYQANPHLYETLPPGTDLRSYVAGGLVVLSLTTLKPLLSVQLDLTTDYTERKAMIYSQPTVVDLDGDGEDELIVGTSLGLVYVLAPSTGLLRPGWPVVMHEVQAQVVVEDINGDGRLELVVSDSKGNVVALDANGKEVWHTRCSGAASQAVTIADINQDGVLDVLVGTSSGQLWAYSGDTGDLLPHFPFKTDGKIIAPLTVLTPADHSPTSLPLIVFPSFDGRLYIVDAAGCSETIDVGERSYAAVLADSVLGTPYLDLLLATMSGNIYLLHTDIPFHPLLARTSHTHALTDPMDYHGVYWADLTRSTTHHRGRTLWLSFRIVDRRAKAVTPKLQGVGVVSAKYNVSILLDRHVLYSHWHYRPGEYRVSVTAPSGVGVGMLRVRMMNEHRQRFEDKVRVVMNGHWYRIVKWMLSLPMLLMAVLFTFTFSQQQYKHLTLTPALPQ